LSRRKGAFYVFPSCAEAIGCRRPGGKTIATDADFMTALLEAEGGPSFRVSYAASTQLLEDACAKIQKLRASLVTVHIPRPFRRRASRGSWAA
jgi:aspartate aminotransferase